MVAFGGVVEDHIENDLDARAVQRLDHVAKFVDRAERILTRAVGLVRRKERNRRVAPVVHSAPAGILSIELKHRQQLDRRDAQLLQVRESSRSDRRMCHASFRQAGARMCGEAAHVHLVDDRA